MDLSDVAPGMARSTPVLNEYVTEAIPNPEGADPVHTVMRLTEADFEASGLGWDNYTDPMLFMVIGHPEGEGVGALHVPVPPVFDHPVEMLEFLAYVFSEQAGPFEELFTGGDFYGYLLITEGWYVPRPPDSADPVEIEAWNLARAQNAFHRHPDRVEERLGTMLTIYDRAVLLRRARGDIPNVTDYYPDSENVLNGRVIDAMRALIEASRKWLPTDQREEL